MIEDPKTMTSPITGGRVTLHWEWRDMEYRKETFRVMFPFFRCEDTGERFTTTESDGVWWNQMLQQYCQRHGLPYKDEIIALRKRYGLNATKMSLILGFGENQYRKYELEEFPNISNGKMIRSAMNPKVFLDLVESSRGVLSDKEYVTITARVKALIAKGDEWKREQYDVSRLYAMPRGEANGFAPISLPRLKDILLTVLQECGEVFCTKMNKLLFYIDFLSYRQRGMAMTGLTYRAIDYGPVPDRWDRVYSEFDEIQQEPRPVGDYEGNVLVGHASPAADTLSDDETAIIRAVCRRFKDATAREISVVSHAEPAWQNHQAARERIPFAEAFALKAL